MVGHAVLGEVVCADLLGPLAGPHLRPAVGGDLRLLRRQLHLVEACAQHPQRLLAVLELRLLVLHRHDDPGGLVGDADGRVGRVHRLSARPRRAVHVDLEVVRVDLHVDLLGLGKYRHGGGRGVDPALRLRLRHALDAVGAALVLEDAVGTLALHLECVVAVGDRQRLELEAAPLGVAGEHPVEVAGEQPRLLPARARADLDDHVLLVTRVRLDHREPDLLVELGESRLGGAKQLAQLRVVAVLGEQLASARGVARRLPVLVGELVRRLERAVLAPDLGVAGAIGNYGWVRELVGQLVEPGLYLVDQLLDHEIEASGSGGQSRGDGSGFAPLTRGCRTNGTGEQ